MNLLKDILYDVRIENIQGNTNINVSGIGFDSRKIKKDQVFVAVKGAQSDGHEYINMAINNGASTIVCEQLPNKVEKHVTYVQVKDSHEALGIMAANFYDNPSKDMKLVGITGTNGKTTSVTLLHNLFTSLGYKAGLLSTVNNKIGEKSTEASLTTPDPVQLNALLQEMCEQGCQYCFMEVSSHAVVQRRIAGLHFSIAVFTNITHDHLDYHKTFDNYLKAKKRFFDDLPSNAFALVNKDDRNADVMVQNTKAKVKTLAVKTLADYKIRITENTFDGLVLNYKKQDLWTRMMGDFNAYNILVALSVTDLLELDQMEVLTAVSNLKPVEGRFQYLQSQEKITAIVDYAHTPDALKNVLSTINNIRTGNEQLISVIGCGGDRDRTKRPLMAQKAAELSDRVILTSDNPRTENPDAIISDMSEGLNPVDRKKTISISNREEAIRTACSISKAGDIILVAGKGHEKYQEINGKRTDFDDVKIIEDNLKIVSE